MNIESLIWYILGGLLPFSILVFLLGRRKALWLEAKGQTLHSRPWYHGWYVVILMGLPPLIITLIASLLRLLGVLGVPPLMLFSTALVTAAAGLWFAMHQIRPSLRARNAVEELIKWLLLIASLVSILTTMGIVVSILFEAIRFFELVSFWEFLTGTQWSPETAFLGAAGRGGELIAEPKFGSIPIFAGTFMITIIAMAVAVPIGLFSAVYMSEYATYAVRSGSKPILEILAGIPTVVYGFFAAMTVSPLVVEIAGLLRLDADYTNALSPGIVMGIMIIPFVSSLSDDVINAVPQSLREGSYALGMTTSETVKHVVLPAALPGIVSAFLLAVSRALGETMIVVMAAGLRPNLTWNPLEGMTTVTVRIVDALTGDQAFDSPETLSAFGLGLVLLLVTLSLNIISSVVIRRFRQRYE